MKKLLKNGAFILAISTVLFSCAAPTNTKTIVAPDTGTIAPYPETIRPTDLVKPEGYTPSPNAKFVTEDTPRRDVESLLKNSLLIEYNAYKGTIDRELRNKILSDPKNVENQNKLKTLQKDYFTNVQNKRNWNVSEKLTYKPAQYNSNYGSSTSNLFEDNYLFDLGFDNNGNKIRDYYEWTNDYIFSYRIDDASKIEAGPNPKCLKTFKLSISGKNINSPYSNKETATLAAMFDNGSLKGIVFMEFTADPSKPYPDVTNCTFYNLEGKEPFEYFKK